MNYLSFFVSNRVRFWRPRRHTSSQVSVEHPPSSLLGSQAYVIYRASSRVPAGRGKSVVWVVWGPGEYEKRFSIEKPLSWGVLRWKWLGYLSSHFRVDNAAFGLAFKRVIGSWGCSGQPTFLPLKLSLWVMRFKRGKYHCYTPLEYRSGVSFQFSREHLQEKDCP